MNIAWWHRLSASTTVEGESRSAALMLLPMTSTSGGRGRAARGDLEPTFPAVPGIPGGAAGSRRG